MIFILVRRNSLKSKSLNYEFIYYKHHSFKFIERLILTAPIHSKVRE